MFSTLPLQTFTLPLVQTHSKKIGNLIFDLTPLNMLPQLAQHKAWGMERWPER